MMRFLIAAGAVAVCVAPVAALPPSNAKTLEHAEEVLADLNSIPLKGIPAKLLADAHGVVIVPRVIKAGFVVGGRGGHGVVLVKEKDGNWSDPVFVDLGGASVGFQAGVESTDVVLVFRNRKTLDRLLEGKGKLTLGADASVAAGPVGRMAAAATDAKLEAEIVSYSRSRGLFAGVSLDGTTIHANRRNNMQFRQPGREAELKLADSLKAKLVEMSTEKPVPAAQPGAPVLMPPVPTPPSSAPTPIPTPVPPPVPPRP
ncbi:lipid-binding SYLF domain-containing protein [Gemmata sp. JC717]|uniref:lipid-binding SYLF domain-containing protein n=1 Tax=Gemmata algarum TaxID=2975278 RepID=UPI0021BB6B4A|nr:lipid-binding SYLF domain-containing protein [Gemmata algarum]MDY3554203.1 lipid-binding SYLF domain-containing protein [Gemmata algarum]